MMDDRDIGHEIERVAAGLVGLALLASVCIRLWRLSSGIFYETVWSAIAGTPLIAGRSSWDYGLREVSPSGELVAYATILIVVALILGAILDCRRCYWLAGGVVVSGYLVNACLMLRLLARLVKRWVIVSILFALASMAGVVTALVGAKGYAPEFVFAVTMSAFILVFCVFLVWMTYRRACRRNRRREAEDMALRRDIAQYHREQLLQEKW